MQIGAIAKWIGLRVDECCLGDVARAAEDGLRVLQTKATKIEESWHDQKSGSL
jgi:hypothetical protein